MGIDMMVAVIEMKGNVTTGMFYNFLNRTVMVAIPSSTKGIDPPSSSFISKVMF